MKNHPLPSCAACEYLSLWFILPWLLLIYSITDQASLLNAHGMPGAELIFKMLETARALVFPF